MERIRFHEMAAHAGTRVRMCGWLQSIRKIGAVNFLVIREAGGVYQAVASANELEPLTAAGAQVESVLEIEGTVTAAKAAPGGFELQSPRIRVLSAVTEPLPVSLARPIEAHLPVLLDHAVAINRHPSRRAVFRIGAALMRGFRSALGERSFVEIQSPKLVEIATEGGANVFPVEYFGRTAYLAQSPQFYKQIMVGVFERVFEVGPVFRAEPHDTVRHVNQYTSLDAEMGFIESHLTVMEVLTEVVRGMLATASAECARELALLGVTAPAVPPVIPRIHFAEAQALLGENEPDLSPEGERKLGEWARKEHGSEWLFVTGYPMAKRPFYTHPEPGNAAHSNSFDLLFRGTELVTGGQRLHRYEEYVAAIAAKGVPESSVAAYLEAFRAGMPPHGGFAIGLERFLMQWLGLPNIRLAALFPRDLSRLSP